MAAMLRVPSAAVAHAVNPSPWGSPFSCRVTAVPHGLASRKAEPDAETPSEATNGTPLGVDGVPLRITVAPSSTPTMMAAAAASTVAVRQRRGWLRLPSRSVATVSSARLSAAGGTAGEGWRTWSRQARHQRGQGRVAREPDSSTSSPVDGARTGVRPTSRGRLGRTKALIQPG